MRKLIKHNLEYEKTFSYFSDHVECGFTLSKRILEEINFKRGQFYTLLPECADATRLYKLSSGWILPQLGPVEHPVFANYWPTPNTTIELSEFIFNYLKKNNQNTAIFEHIIGKTTDKNLYISGTNLAVMGEGIYYGIQQAKSSEVVRKTINKIKEIWHFLTVLTHGVGRIRPTLTNKDIDRIINNTSCIIIGAYDGEGYLFWEKN